MTENPAYDADLELAIEQSRQTFREEEQRRRRATTEGHDAEGDLIRFDNPEDAERKKKNDQVGIFCFFFKKNIINFLLELFLKFIFVKMPKNHLMIKISLKKKSFQICRLFSQPNSFDDSSSTLNPIGWRPNLAIAHTSHAFQPPASTPSTSGQPFHYPSTAHHHPQHHFSTHLGHSHSASSLHYTPSPSNQSLLLAAAGFPSPRLAFPVLSLPQTVDQTPPPRPPKPPHFTKHTTGTGQEEDSSNDVPPELPPRLNRPPPRPRHRHSSETHVKLPVTDSLNVLTLNQDEVGFTHMPCTSPFPSAPANAYQYVPYASTSSYAHLLNGDLIDLNDDANEGSKELTLEEIRREFDPLYVPLRKRPTSEASMPPEQLQENRNVENYVSSPVIQRIKTEASSPVSDRGKENAECRKPSKITDIRLTKITPVINEKVKSIENRHFLSHESTPSLFVSPTADYMTTRADTVKVLVCKDHSWRSTDITSKALICDINQPIENLTNEALFQLLTDDQLKSVNAEEYGLKIYGFNEFLSRTSSLGQNIYTGFCLLYGQDVGKLEIERPKLEHGLPEWERMKSQIKYSSMIDKEDIENALCNLSQKMDDYEAAFGSGNTLEISKTTAHTKQSLKLICKLLNGIVPEKLYLQMQKYLAATNEDQLFCHREDFIMELRNFISTYCKCTVSSWAVEQNYSKPQERMERMEVLACKDSLRIMLNSIHNIPEHWARDYADFSVSVDIYHGTQILDGHQNKIARTIDKRMFFPIIPLDLYAVFNRMQICQCPKETKLVISISGRQNSPASVPQPGVNNTQPNKLLLAYTSVSLFDIDKNIRQGVYYLPLTALKGPMLKPFGPYPYIKDASDPILVMTFKTWDKIIYFPDVIVDFQSVSQDFTKLDIETQEYIIELIEQADTTRLESDDKELLWQKRAYLMNQPEALPLVLASVSDWSYPFLSQVYQILDEWAPLKPELAMQLLLPQ
ncbi:hypothetical protein WR25_15640 isoform C [Diploscapter pachys]|uniref:Uncharacterized protein n=1 Tax=Diploscapter pachys TaxID=2018661 RepID=A0A2A2KUR0_9BILA|nr:hypothetical protein WR25_15640 isoform C [Diploscapter pachys]